MNIHFIDTSIFTNILDIPYRNQEKEIVINEFKSLLKTKDIDKLILPFATIIETGNHIAHNGNGSQRRAAAIHRIRIWTLDKHMKEMYDEIVTNPKTRNGRVHGSILN